MERRHDRGARRGPRRPRRPPPPARTGLESEFLERARRDGTRLVLRLADGRTVRGSIEDFDRDLITIDDAGGAIVIRKTEIRYLYEE